MRRNILLALLFIGIMAGSAFAHCQIPCGIYDDHMRFAMMREEIKTIEKSMNEINTLSMEKDKNFNQIVRWVMNKDEHADALSNIVTYYFMTQRITPVEMPDMTKMMNMKDTKGMKGMEGAKDAKDTQDTKNAKDMKCMQGMEGMKSTEGAKDMKCMMMDNPEMKAHHDYMNKLKLLHQILIYSMKAKQTTDLQYIDKLNQAVDAFEKAYFAGQEEGHEH
ncbi:MAG: superoxide dismutase, Ni [Chloroflexi bacterium]|nr:superoxide dismutase, Ni [Chloroflexota bacterium]